MLDFFIVIMFVTFPIIIGLLLYLSITLYNRLVKVKHNIKKSWANIDVLLSQFHDELPKLVETCRQHVGYEAGTLERIVQARSEAVIACKKQDMTALGRAESQLHTGLSQLFALSEQYPILKASDSFNQLQQRISALSESIADRRELYNEAVNHNNVLIEQFPNSIIARLFNFKAAPLLKFTEEQTSDVDINQLFNR